MVIEVNKIGGHILVEFIHSLLRKEQIIYVFKEYMIKNDLGWYFICFMRKDLSTHTFQCWYNSTSVGKTLFDLTTKVYSKDTLQLKEVGYYTDVECYNKDKFPLLTLNNIQRIEQNFRKQVEEKIKLCSFLDTGYEISTSIQFDPVLLFFFEVKKYGVSIGSLYFINGRFIPIGLYSEEILSCIIELEEVFGHGQEFYRYCLK